MRCRFGYDALKLKRSDPSAGVDWEWSRLVNPHIMLVGMSGAGKSHTVRSMVSQLSGTKRADQSVRFHVFDVHGDMEIEGESAVLFSEQTHYGLNPLRVNPDPHFGGVRKRVQGFIRTLNRVSTQALGVKQEACLRNILFDVYAMAGFRQDDPSTWLVRDDESALISDGSDGRLYLDIPLADKDKAKALGVARWDAEKRLWWVPIEHYAGGITQWPVKRKGRAHPTIGDVLAYARRVLQMSYLGSDQEAVTRLEAFNRSASAYQRRVLEAARRGDPSWSDSEAEGALEKAASKAVDAYCDYVNSIKTGRELDNLMKYDSTDVLKSVVDRLEAMSHTGIFKERAIPFDPRCSVHRYQLQALSVEEKKMFVLFRLEELFAQAMQRGIQDRVVEVVVLDEFAMYTSAAEDPDNILNVIAREGRKYSLGMVCAAQSPLHFPDDLVSSIATKVVLGVDDRFWRPMGTKMRIEERLLEWIRIQRTIAVQMKERGEAKNEWRWVVLKDAVSAFMSQAQKAA